MWGQPLQFARAAVTQYHRLSGLNNRNLFSLILEAGSPRSRCQQGRFLLSSVREGCVPGLSPWLLDGCLLPVSARLPSVCVCDKFPVLTRTPVILD